MVSLVAVFFFLSCQACVTSSTCQWCRETMAPRKPCLTSWWWRSWPPSRSTCRVMRHSFCLPFCFHASTALLTLVLCCRIHVRIQASSNPQKLSLLVCCILGACWCVAFQVPVGMLHFRHLFRMLHFRCLLVHCLFVVSIGILCFRSLLVFCISLSGTCWCLVFYTVKDVD